MKRFTFNAPRAIVGTVPDVPCITTDEEAERLFGPWARGLVSEIKRRYPPVAIHNLTPDASGVVSYTMPESGSVMVCCKISDDAPPEPKYLRDAHGRFRRREACDNIRIAVGEVKQEWTVQEVKPWPT